MEKIHLLTMDREDNICWFHGKVSREKAEEILINDANAKDGTFLVRESNTAAGDFVLSVLHQGEVVHYQIRRHGEDAFFSIDEQTIIHGLETLIEYYHESSHCLVTKLVTVCKKFPPPHDSRRHGSTNLLHRATKEGNYTVVSELLKCGYRSLEAKNQDGQTAVHLASHMGKDDILKKLIESGANVNCRDTAGNTPLHYACQNNLPITARVLVQLGGANIQVRNTETGWVPLHEAAARGHKETVMELLALNAPVKPRTLANQTPADLAQKNGQIECFKLLRRYKCPAPRAHKQDWYHGTLDRNEALAMLREQGNGDGTFLVRYSDRNGGMYVLTTVHAEQPYHFRIRTQGAHFFLDDGPYLDSLEHVIEHYSSMSDGLPTILQFPVPPTPKPPVPDTSILNGLAATLPNRRKGRQSNSSLNTSASGASSTASVDTASTSVTAAPASVKTAASTLPARRNAAPLDSGPFDTIAWKQNLDGVISPPSVPVGDQEAAQDLIPRGALVLGSKLGVGDSGLVYKGIYATGTEVLNVAIKTLHEEHTEAYREEFLREAKVMTSLHHHCVVKLMGVCQGPPLLMVQELVPLGSMLAYLQEFPDRVSPNYELKMWASQIACGMKYLEEQRFVHRDLAARNILLASRHQAKISDFGLSRALGGDREYYRATQGGRWPIKWYAPESFNFGTFSHASDVWSFGVTLWEMFSLGQQPYGEMRGAEVIQKVETGERLEQPPQCPDSVYQTMEQCWAYQPRDRPTFASLLEQFAIPEYINIAELAVDVGSPERVAPTKVGTDSV